MQKTGTLAVMALVLGTAIAHADMMKTPKSDREFFDFTPEKFGEYDPQTSDTCQFPAEPKVKTPDKRSWLTPADAGPRLLRAIYHRSRSENIVSTERCSCQEFAPAWDAALQRFDAVAETVPVSGWGMETRENNARSNALAKAVAQICESEGVL